MLGLNMLNANKASPSQVNVRLVPMLAILYLISQLDRANIGNAKIEGLDKDLKLTGVQYNIVLSLFFVPYVLLGKPLCSFPRQLRFANTGTPCRGPQ